MANPPNVYELNKPLNEHC